MPVRYVQLPRHKVLGLVECVPVGDRFLKIAGDIQVVSDEATVPECAIDKPAIGEGTAPKNAVREPTIDEVGRGEQAPCTNPRW